MASIHFQLSQRFGGGVFPTFEAADAAYRAELEKPENENFNHYMPRIDIVEYEDGRPVFFNDEVKVSNLSAFHGLLDKLNRKAAKLGLPAISVQTGEKRIKAETREDPDSGRKYTVRYEVVMLRVVGQEIKLAGYEFFGRVDNEHGAVLICGVPGKEMPARYREWNNVCDHCHQNRSRKSYYVFRSDAGEFLKVGSTCLKDFMGHSAAQALWLAALDKRLREAGEEADRMGGGGEPLHGLMVVLAVAAAVIRDQKGYVSKAAAQAYAEKSGGTRLLETTAEKVSRQFWKKLPEGEERIEVLEVDRRVAQRAVKWFKELVASKGGNLSDYEHNLLAMMEARHFGQRRFGLVVSLIGVYLRAMGELEKRKTQVNEWVGQVGQRRDFEGEFVSQRSFEGNYGLVTFTKVRTPEGMVTVQSSRDWWSGDLEKGRVLKFKATIKKHGQWKEFKETVVNRAVELAAPVAA